MYPDETRASVLHFLDAALAYYARLGIHFRALLTDNGVSYRSHAFADRCRELGLKHRRTRPYTPRTNGTAERFIQTALREWVYTRTCQNSAEREQLPLMLKCDSPFFAVGRKPIWTSSPATTRCMLTSPEIFAAIEFALPFVDCVPLDAPTVVSPTLWHPIKVDASTTPMIDTEKAVLVQFPMMCTIPQTLNFFV